MIKHILFVSRFLNGGGAERVISVLANSLVKNGYKVSILTYIKNANDYPVDKHVKRYTLGNNYSENEGGRFTRTFYRHKTIRKKIKKIAPDVIVPFLHPVLKETFFSTRGLKIPIVATIRNIPEFGKKSDEILYNSILKQCTAVHFQTKEQKKFFTEKLEPKSFVIPNPVDDSFLKIGSERKYNSKIKKIVTAGRLEPQKNHKLLIKAMKTVHETHPDCKLEIYGDGNLKQELQELINASGQSEYVFLKGRCDEIAKVYSSADMFVLSSNFEGMPNALAEAMASGLPCVSTDCPTGPKTLIGNNERGLLINMNDEAEMINAINSIIDDPQKAAESGNCAHKFINSKLNADVISKSFIANIEKHLH